MPGRRPPLATGAFWAVRFVATAAAGPHHSTRAVGVMTGGLTLANVIGVPIGSFAGQFVPGRGRDSLTAMDAAAPTAPAFRTATAADVPALVALVESAYRGEASRAGWTTEADILKGRRTDPEGVLAVIEGRGSRLVAVERGGELVACCQLEQRDDHAYFGMFAVRPVLQGAGLGTLVIAEAERFAREEWGVAALHMTVISVRTDLIAWYVRRGYVRTGRMSPFPYGDERFGLPTRDDLQFELLTKNLG